MIDDGNHFAKTYRLSHHSHPRRTFRNPFISRKQSHPPRISRVRSKPRISIGGPFGEVVKKTGVVSGQSFGFSTKYRDDETELLYYGRRYYQSITGRWLSRDPLGENGGLSLYGFIWNAPIFGIDPIGLEIKWKVLTDNEVIAAFEVQANAKGHEANPIILWQLQGRYGFQVWYNGDCTCKKNSLKKGSVALVQYLDNGWFRHKWVVDDGGYSARSKPRSVLCPDGTPVVNQPGYLDPDPGSGYSGTPGNIPGSYVDSPTFSQTFKVEAWCRCDCEDDYLMQGETLFIKYKTDGTTTAGKSP